MLITFLIFFCIIVYRFIYLILNYAVGKCILSILFCLYIYNLLKSCYDSKNPYYDYVNPYCRLCPELNHYDNNLNEDKIYEHYCRFLGRYIYPYESSKSEILASDTKIDIKRVLKNILFIIVSVFAGGIVYFLLEFTLFKILFAFILTSFCFTIYNL